jgi:hypothetical protein
VFELEHRTALEPLGQRVALRQVLHAAAELEANLPRQLRTRPADRQTAPTHLLDEDTYPIGGFASISTRGTIESLLHSQLAYMETDERPDLFDVKFLRDELLYYSRDENQYLRRRRTLVFALFPDLTQARVKDPGAPVQRIVLAQAFLVAAIRRLIAALAAEALRVEILFIKDGSHRLSAERRVLERIFREEIARGTVVVAKFPTDQLAAHCAQHARRSLCQCLTVSTARPSMDAEEVPLASLVCGSEAPQLLGFNERRDVLLPTSQWGSGLVQLLTGWLSTGS